MGRYHRGREWGDVRMQTEQNPRAEFQRPTTVVLVDDERLIRGAMPNISSCGLDSSARPPTARTRSSSCSPCAPMSC